MLVALGKNLNIPGYERHVSDNPQDNKVAPFVGHGYYK